MFKFLTKIILSIKIKNKEKIVSTVFYFSCHMIYFFVAMQSENTVEKCLKVKVLLKPKFGLSVVTKV